MATSSACTKSWCALAATSRSEVDDEQGLADTKRKHFELAGSSEERIERFKLDTPGELPRRFRSWRDAGRTWARRAGHKGIATTMKYVVEAENRSATFGTPFPPLPLALLRAAKLDGPELEPTGTADDFGCERRELNSEPTEAFGDSSEKTETGPTATAEMGGANPAIDGHLGTELRQLPKQLDLDAELAAVLKAATAAGAWDAVAKTLDTINARAASSATRQPTSPKSKAAKPLRLVGEGR